MKQILAFVVGYMVALHAVASPGPEKLKAMEAPLASKSLLLDIVAIDQSKLVAVGERGHILFSHDAKHWQQANVPIQSTLTSVFFLNESLGWAVGHDASILHSNDGGEHWQIQQYLPELEKPLFDVVFKDANNGIAIGAYGEFFRTQDGGKHWKIEFHEEFLSLDDRDYLAELKAEDQQAYNDEIASILPHFNRLFNDDGTLYLAGEIGLLAKSHDFGVSWQKFDEIYQGSFFDISRTQDGNLLAVGLRGNVFRSIKNGTKWQHIATQTTGLLNSVVLGGDNQIFLLGNNGVLLESKDDGQTFDLRIQADGKAMIAGVWFDNRIVAVSDVGIKTITPKNSGLSE